MSEKPGVAGMLAGAAIFSLGAGVTAITAFAAIGGRFVVAGGAMLVGVVIAVRGLITFVSHQDESKPRPQTTIAISLEDSRVLVAVLAGALFTPKTPSPRELAAIRATLALVQNVNPKDHELAELGYRIQNGPEPLISILRKHNEKLDPRLRPIIVRGMFNVLSANGGRGYLMPAVSTVGKAMGLSEANVLEIVRDLTCVLDGKDYEVTLSFKPDDVLAGKRVTFAYESTLTCDKCAGEGCGVCDQIGVRLGERTVTAVFPQNFKAGGRFRCVGEGGRPFLGGRAGDLTISVEVA